MTLPPNSPYSFLVILLSLLAVTGCREDPAWGEVRIYFEPIESADFEVLSMEVVSIHNGLVGDTGVRNGDAFQPLRDQRNQSGALDAKLDFTGGPAYLTTYLPPQTVERLRTVIWTAELRNVAEDRVLEYLVKSAEALPLDRPLQVTEGGVHELVVSFRPDVFTRIDGFEKLDMRTEYATARVGKP